MNSIELGKRLKTLREYRDMKQVELAKRIKLDASQICRYEHGTETGSLTLVRICQVLQVSLDALFAHHPYGFDPRRCDLHRRNIWHKLDGDAGDVPPPAAGEGPDQGT